MASFNNIQAYLQSMTLHDKEYDIIMNLIENADPRFFTKILEEVVDEELFWIDFYPIFDSSDYKALLENTFESQEKLAYEISNLATFRNNVIASDTFNKLGITMSHANYKLLEKDERRQRLFDILQVKQTDNTLNIACKAAILNAILNFEIVKKSQTDSDIDNDIYFNSNNELTRQKMKIDSETGEEYNETEYFNYLNPDDILISADDLIIPIDSRYQVLNESDRSFMIENNLTEDQMKQFKALSMFIEQSQISKRQQEGDNIANINI